MCFHNSDMWGVSGTVIFICEVASNESYSKDMEDNAADVYIEIKIATHMHSMKLCTVIGCIVSLWYHAQFNGLKHKLQLLVYVSSKDTLQFVKVILLEPSACVAECKSCNTIIW